MPPSYKLASHTTNASQRRELAWGAAWRITVWGMGLGAVLGGMFGGALLSGNGGYMVGLGLLAGAVAGSALGLVEGISIGAMLATNIARSRIIAPAGYQSLAGGMSLIGVAMVYVLLSIGVLAVSGRPLDWAGASCIPFLLNLGATWVAGTRVAAWLERTTQAHANADSASQM